MSISQPLHRLVEALSRDPAVELASLRMDTHALADLLAQAREALAAATPAERLALRADLSRLDALLDRRAAALRNGMRELAPEIFAATAGLQACARYLARDGTAA